MKETNIMDTPNQMHKAMAHHVDPIVELARRAPREGTMPMSQDAEGSMLSIVTHAARLGFLARQWANDAEVEEERQLIRNALITSMNDLRVAYNDVEPEEPPEAPALPDLSAEMADFVRSHANKYYDELVRRSGGGSEEGSGPPEVPAFPKGDTTDIVAMLRIHSQFVDSFADIITEL